MPSIDGNYSFELLAGTRDGKVACFSGGVDTTTVSVLNDLTPSDFKLFQNYLLSFQYWGRMPTA